MIETRLVLYITFYSFGFCLLKLHLDNQESLNRPLTRRCLISKEKNMFAVSKVSSLSRVLLHSGRMNYSATAALFERFTVPVPPMGESIKNGIECADLL